MGGPLSLNLNVVVGVCNEGVTRLMQRKLVKLVEDTSNVYVLTDRGHAVLLSLFAGDIDVSSLPDGPGTTFKPNSSEE